MISRQGPPPPVEIFASFVFTYKMNTTQTKLNFVGLWYSPRSTHPCNMSGLNKFFNTVSLPQKVAAWGVAGAVFGTWTWFEQRDNGKILTAAEVHERNMKIKKERKSNKQ